MPGPDPEPAGERAPAGEPPPEVTGLRLPGGLTVPADALTWRFTRSGGPGGQKVNTSDTRVAVSVDLAGAGWLPDAARRRLLERLGGRLVRGTLTVTASEHRSQWRNRQEALQRIAELLRDGLRAPSAARRATRPTAAARARRLSDKRRRAEVKRARRPPGPE
jgi:ribosome-associated protein